MCGITGFWDFKKRFSVNDQLAENMAAQIQYRGPDSYGTWLEHEQGLALAHRRLAIVDLSPAGHQPMVSPSGRYVMVYNGEVFNGDEIKQALSPHPINYKGHSDTEIMLAAFDTWGIEAATKQFIGMFAFAVWDKNTQTLTIARDRVGIKPLYYSFINGVWLFGSELKSLMQHPAFHKQINNSAAKSFLTFGYVPESECIFDNVLKVKPGTIINLKADGTKDIQTYWNLAEVISQARTKKIEKTDAEWTDEVHNLLKDAVKRRMQADVPLGAFLSGGIDSSLVVSLMQSQSANKIKTFSIGFSENSYNEAPYAKQVAQHLGTDHYEMYVNPAQAMEVIPNLASMYDEPFADVSQIPTYLVSKLAREHVTVSLSGDGGDELFAGYNRYTFGRVIENAKKYTPDWVLKVLAKFPQQAWQALEKLPGVPKQLARKVETTLKILQYGTTQERYQTVVTHWNIYNQPLFEKHPHLKEPIEQFQYFDILSYLCSDILTKVDRASMAVSLEARVPLLDHRLIELAWQLPMNMKIKGIKGKHVLREILKQYVPSEYFERPKMGFGVPIDSWLRHQLKPLAENLLFASDLNEFGISKNELENCWQQHQNGTANNQYKIWAVMMLQLWKQRYL
jgi:asparagine synthase (glutamine-hydrolysing)